MNFDEMKQAWQQQALTGPVLPPTSALFAAVQASSRKFERKIFWRDVREIGAGLLLILFTVFPFRPGTGSEGWRVLSLALIIFTTGFLWIARRRVQGRRAAFPATLLGELDWAIAHTGHQIWLLRSVAWWYILPLTASTFASALHRGKAVDTAHWIRLGIVCAGIAAVVYYLNQRAVRRKLQPKLEELLTQRENWRQIGDGGSDVSR